jgi:hypothetical protein
MVDPGDIMLRRHFKNSHSGETGTYSIMPREIREDGEEAIRGGYSAQTWAAARGYNHYLKIASELGMSLDRPDSQWLDASYYGGDV